MKIKLSDINYTGCFGGVNFVNSIAEVDAIPKRLERCLKVTGKTVEEVVEKKRRRRKKSE